MSLRARLLIGLISLTAAGLVIAGLVTYAAERSFLVSRVDTLFSKTTINGFEDTLDQELGLTNGGAVRARRAPATPATPAASSTVRPAARAACRAAAAARSARCSPRRPAPTASTSPPMAGRRGTSSAVRAARRRSCRPRSRCRRRPHPRLFTVDSDAGSSLQYRVLRKVSDTGTGTMTIAIPLTDVSQTLTRLRNIELIVIAAVLARRSPPSPGS